MMRREEEKEDEVVGGGGEGEESRGDAWAKPFVTVNYGTKRW